MALSETAVKGIDRNSTVVDLTLMHGLKGTLPAEYGCRLAAVDP